jgi:DNA-binding response OmpR family regulator
MRIRSSVIVSGFHRPHILIVSDDQDLSQFLRDGLTYAGFFTSVVASALQTLEVFRLRTFDLALIDALLEDLGAGPLIQRLREPAGTASAPRTDIPLLILADSESELPAAEANRIGAEGVIHAPIEIEDLAVDLFKRIGDWRSAHPDRPWADELAQRPG